jgi:hypothetical protein
VKGLLKAGAKLCQHNRGGVPCKRPEKHNGHCTSQWSHQTAAGSRPDSSVARVERVTCCRCQQRKAEDEFTTNQWGQRKRSAFCKGCRRANRMPAQT